MAPISISSFSDLSPHSGYGRATLAVLALTAMTFLLGVPAAVKAQRDSASLNGETNGDVNADVHVDVIGAEIVRLAQQAAGGESWRSARSLMLEGSATFYRGGKLDAASEADSYRMWRQFPSRSEDAHAANGRVRFDARSGDRVLFQISFDGERSYDQNGPIDDAAATERWKSNFGFGIFRFALKDGFSVLRMADDTIDGHRCFFVQVIDPSDRKTLFAIDQQSYAIRMVGFDTPQGFHHRVYDKFYRQDGVNFTQPGHVRLYYDGVKTADIQWTRFTLNADIPANQFAINAPEAE